jgi:hypothetical protein
MPLGRILPRPSGTVPAQRYGGDLTGAWEAAEESTAGPHWRVDGGAAELVGIAGQHSGLAATYEDGGGEG